jgi:hypothetical protein
MPYWWLGGWRKCVIVPFTISCGRPLQINCPLIAALAGGTGGCASNVQQPGGPPNPLNQRSGLCPRLCTACNSGRFLLFCVAAFSVVLRFFLARDYNFFVVRHFLFYSISCGYPSRRVFEFQLCDCKMFPFSAATTVRIPQRFQSLLRFHARF